MHVDAFTLAADLVVVAGGVTGLVRAAWRMVHTLENLHRELADKLEKLDARVRVLERRAG